MGANHAEVLQDEDEVVPLSASDVVVGPKSGVAWMDVEERTKRTVVEKLQMNHQATQNLVKLPIKIQGSWNM